MLLCLFLLLVLVFLFGNVFCITYASKVRAACIVVPYKNHSPVGEWKVLYSICKIWYVWAKHSAEGETFLPVQPSFHSGIKLVAANMVVIAIDMYGEIHLWGWIYGIT